MNQLVKNATEDCRASAQNGCAKWQQYCIARVQITSRAYLLALAMSCEVRGRGETLAKLLRLWIEDLTP